jgi:hypothetical protein
MEVREIKRDDLICKFDGSDSDNKNIASVNSLRRKLFMELEKIPGVKEVFVKYNVFFVEGYDAMNRINIDWPKQEVKDA